MSFSLSAKRHSLGLCRAAGRGSRTASLLAESHPMGFGGLLQQTPHACQRGNTSVLVGREAKSLLPSGNHFASLKMRGLDQGFPKLERSSNDQQV